MLKPLRNIPIRLGGFGGLFGPQSVDVVPGHARILAGAIAVDGTVDFGGTDVPFTAMATPQLVGDNQIALINLSATVYGSPIPPSMLAQAAQQTRLTLPPEVARGVTVHVLGLTITPGHLGVGARVVVTQLAQ